MKIEEIINLHDISSRKLAAKNLATKRIKRKKQKNFHISNIIKRIKGKLCDDVNHD
jgi:hypothetical protein|tara:strand:- start:160 stop:327 length:168 start_codon:yes stop_codon:yes gene_type:complete